jgi:signal transduction histidine kinase
MLHELLSENRDEIVGRCARKLHARHPDRPVEELLDTIPQFLDEIIKAERREAGLPEHTPLPDDPVYARAHGEQRFRRGYEPAVLPMDFGTISDVIGELAIEHDLHLDPRAYKLLNECLDTAIAQSITEYFTLRRTSDDLEIAEWVGCLGHELRNAVATGLMAYAALRSGQVGVDSRTSRILERSLRRAEVLVAQTLAAAHLRAGVPLQCATIDVKEFVSDVVASACVDRDIRLVVDVPPELTMNGDAHLLESALSNLVQNAVKFTHERGTVTISARPSHDGVCIEVLDECGGLGGRGEELFGAFVRGKPSKGVGLGLAITKQSIEAHGGYIRVTDRAPVGCTFTIWIPPSRCAIAP